MAVSVSEQIFCSDMKQCIFINPYYDAISDASLVPGVRHCMCLHSRRGLLWGTVDSRLHGAMQCSSVHTGT
jgi:hypothetical protein